MLKVLIVTAGFLPAQKYGGPVVSISNICNLLHGELDIYIITSDHESKEKERFNDISEGWNERYNAKILYLNENEINANNIKKVIDEIHPDFVYLNSFFRAKWTMPVLKLCKSNNIPLLIAPRGEFCKNAFKIKKFKKLPYTKFIKHFYLPKNLYFQATSKEESDQIIKILGVESNRVLFLDNIPSTPEKPLKKFPKNSNYLRCVFISRLNPKKNILFAIKVLGQLKGRVEFNIYGSIEDINYWKNIQKEINATPNNITIKYCGTLKHENVHKTFSEHDIFLFPTLSENYGHVIVESMLSKCPVVVSDQTPWNDINEKDAGWAISLNDEKRFVDVLQKLVDMNNDEYIELVQKNIKYISHKINLEKLKEQYIEAFNLIMKKM